MMRKNRRLRQKARRLYQYRQAYHFKKCPSFPLQNMLSEKVDLSLSFLDPVKSQNLGSRSRNSRRRAANY